MTLQAAHLIRAEWERAKLGFPDRDDRFVIEVACARLYMRDSIELSPEEVREALTLTQHHP